MKQDKETQTPESSEATPVLSAYYGRAQFQDSSPDCEVMLSSALTARATASERLNNLSKAAQLMCSRF